MSDDPETLRDLYWKMYQENCTQGRHHETQRATVATALIGIAAAAIGIATFDKSLILSDLPLTLFVVAIGLFGTIFSAKHYERFSLHMERARFYRKALDDLLTNSPLARLKKDADDENRKNHPFLEPLRLNKFWLGLHVFVILLGLALSALAADDTLIAFIER